MYAITHLPLSLSLYSAVTTIVYAASGSGRAVAFSGNGVVAVDSTACFFVLDIPSFLFADGDFALLHLVSLLLSMCPTQSDLPWLHQAKAHHHHQQNQYRKLHFSHSNNSGGRQD